MFFLSLKFVLILTNSADLSEISSGSSYCLPKYPFIGFHYTKDFNGFIFGQQLCRDCADAGRLCDKYQTSHLLAQNIIFAHLNLKGL